MARSMEGQVAASLNSERLMALLSLFFGVLALLLTSIGLYGVLAYSVAQRTNEIGVRIALGAQRRDVILLVMRQSMAYVAIGISAGVIAVLGSSKLIAAMLYGIRPNDAANLSLAVIVFLLVAGTAAYLPARRASHLEPLCALREE
jgi:ABC-type antimicrobial peptide transport system permease subunit